MYPLASNFLLYYIAFTWIFYKKYISGIWEQLCFGIEHNYWGDHMNLKTETG